MPADIRRLPGERGHGFHQASGGYRHRLPPPQAATIATDL